MQEKKVTKITSSFSRQLKRLMEAKGMKAADLARALDISHVAIGNYLAGVRDFPHGDVLVQMARFFGVTADELLFGPEGEREWTSKPEQIDEVVREQIGLLEELKESDPEGFETVRSVIATYHKSTRRQQAPGSDRAGDPKPDEVIVHRKQKANSALSAEESSALSAVARHGEQPSGDAAKSSPPSEAGEHGSRKGEPPDPSSPETKAPPTARGGRGKK